MAAQRREPYDYYVVVEGLDPGIYSQWEGGNGARARVDGYSGAVHKGFYSLPEALDWYSEMTGGQEPKLWFKEPPYKYFAVTRGREIGIYNQWFGGNGVYSKIMGMGSPSFKGFHELQPAIDWFKEQMHREPELRFNDE